MDSELMMEKLRRQFPELEEGVVKEALMIGDYNFDRASKILQDKYYSSEKGIDKEASLWSSLFGGEEGETTANADWSLDGLSDGVANLGLQIMAGLDNVADTIGSIGDLIPELIFGPEEDEAAAVESAKALKGDKKGQVVVGGGNRSGAVKKRGATGASQKPAPGIAPLTSTDELDDEESNDWTKED